MTSVGTTPAAARVQQPAATITALDDLEIPEVHDGVARVSNFGDDALTDDARMHAWVKGHMGKFATYGQAKKGKGNHSYSIGLRPLSSTIRAANQNGRIQSFKNDHALGFSSRKDALSAAVELSTNDYRDPAYALVNHSREGAWYLVEPKVKGKLLKMSGNNKALQLNGPVFRGGNEAKIENIDPAVRALVSIHGEIDIDKVRTTQGVQRATAVIRKL